MISLTSAPVTFQGGAPVTFQGGAPVTFQGGAPVTFQGGAPLGMSAGDLGKWFVWALIFGGIGYGVGYTLGSKWALHFATEHAKSVRTTYGPSTSS